MRFKICVLIFLCGSGETSGESVEEATIRGDQFGGQVLRGGNQNGPTAL